MTAESTGTLTVCVQDQPVADQFTSIFITFGSVEAKQAVGGEAPPPRTGTATTTANATTAPDAPANTATTGSPRTPTGPAPPGNATRVAGAGSACLQAGGRFQPFPQTTTTPAGTLNNNTTTTPLTGTGTGAPAPVANETEVEKDEAGEGWFEFDLDEPVTVDLLQFSGGLRALLASEDVPAGRYSQLRFNIDRAWGVQTDGSNVDFRVPSGVLRIHEDLEVREDAETKIIVDFDLDRSVVQAGQSGQWILKPVLRVVVEEPAATLTGSPTTPPVTTTAATATTATATSPTTPPP